MNDTILRAAIVEALRHFNIADSDMIRQKLHLLNGSEEVVKIWNDQIAPAFRVLTKALTVEMVASAGNAVDAEVKQALDNKRKTQRELMDKLAEKVQREPRKLFSQLLDGYRDVLMQRLTGHRDPDYWRTDQEQVDSARLAIIREYEHYAGKYAATNLDARQRTEHMFYEMRRSLSRLTCTGGPPTGSGDPIHQHSDGMWWFFDETWADELGPYDSREEAIRACDEYANYVLGPQWSETIGTRGPEA